MLSQDDIRRVLGSLEGSKVSDILNLSPTLEDVEAAAMCLAGNHDVMVKSAHHASALVEAIVDIVCDGEEDPPSRK